MLPRRWGADPGAWALDSPLPNILGLGSLPLWARASQNEKPLEAGNANPNELMLIHGASGDRVLPPLPRQAGQEAKDNGPRQSFHPEISKRHLIYPA